MATPDAPRMSPEELYARITKQEPVTILDVRTEAALSVNPYKIPGARWMPLASVVEQAQQLPHQGTVVAYCTWSEDASSARAALWLQAEGFGSVYALRGGLLAWEQAGYPTTPFRLEQNLVNIGVENTAQPVSSPTTGTSTQATAHAHTFLSGLVGSYAVQHGAPTRKQLTVLFVDIADSTTTVVNQPPEEVLTVVQQFMEVVTDVALAHCGDVKDYEGDGALLYFESVIEATQAALAIRHQLAQTQAKKSHPLQARFSLNIGNVTIGVIGTALRRSVALIGPSINLASRLLKQIPPGGIIATAAVVEHVQREAPELAQQFTLWNDSLELKGFTNERVAAYHMPEHTTRNT